MVQEGDQADPVVAVLDHLLVDHGATYDEAARWLDDRDPDLFALAIHHLAGLARGTAA